MQSCKCVYVHKVYNLRTYVTIIIHKCMLNDRMQTFGLICTRTSFTEQMYPQPFHIVAFFRIRVVTEVGNDPLVELLWMP